MALALFLLLAAPVVFAAALLPVRPPAPPEVSVERLQQHYGYHPGVLAQDVSHNRVQNTRVASKNGTPTLFRGTAKVGLTLMEHLDRPKHHKPQQNVGVLGTTRIRIINDKTYFDDKHFREYLDPQAEAAPAPQDPAPKRPHGHVYGAPASGSRAPRQRHQHLHAQYNDNGDVPPLHVSAAPNDLDYGLDNLVPVPEQTQPPTNPGYSGAGCTRARHPAVWLAAGALIL